MAFWRRKPDPMPAPPSTAAREPEHVVRDLGRHAARAAAEAVMNTTLLVAHPEDRQRIAMQGFFGLFGTVVATMEHARGLHRDPRDIPTDDMRAYGHTLIDTFCDFRQEQGR